MKNKEYMFKYNKILVIMINNNKQRLYYKA